jgi:hypothetical protein
MPEDLNSMLGIAADAPRTTDQAHPTVDYIDYLRVHSACKGLRSAIAATFWFNITDILALISSAKRSQVA